MALLNFGAGIEAEVWIRPEDGAWSVLADGRVVQAGLSWGDALAVGEAIMRTCAGPHAPLPAPLPAPPAKLLQLRRNLRR